MEEMDVLKINDDDDVQGHLSSFNIQYRTFVTGLVYLKLGGYFKLRGYLKHRGYLKLRGYLTTFLTKDVLIIYEIT